MLPAIGRYRVVRRLGHGGMGEVFLAEDADLNRRVAIKILHETSLDAARRARFLREAQTASALNHPNIVTVYEIEAACDTPYIVMEYIDGQPLTDCIPKNGMPARNILRVAIPLADALTKAHEAGILHRDLKPDNIMVTRDGRPKLLDFGLAKLRFADADSDEAQTMGWNPLQTADGVVLGTLPYMSPEQAEGRPLDARSDIFSFGSVLYQAATGQRPFVGDTRAALLGSLLRDVPARITESKPDCPAELDRIIRKSLQKDRERRYGSMREMLSDLEMLRDDLASAPASTGSGSQSAMSTGSSGRVRRCRAGSSAPGSRWPPCSWPWGCSAPTCSTCARLP